MTLDEIVAFIRQSGRPVSKVTLWRWAARHQARNWGTGRAALYSLSDLLEIHRDESRRR
ncbi:hypothetical protein OG618_37380 (plasmid) [Kitasatospora sp. NBC_01246]|uniref:hypothetical protein n=1 Tax=Kitasatospora sp. NBC_01246 TaxID=2903570 RepID=UPI002E3528FC|nr:hypothetical protein [Kitasatospora sp. NBC_01246]